MVKGEHTLKYGKFKDVFKSFVIVETVQPIPWHATPTMTDGVTIFVESI